MKLIETDSCEIVIRVFNSMSSSSFSSADLPWNSRNTDSTSYERQIVSVHNDRGMVFSTIIAYIILCDQWLVWL